MKNDRLSASVLSVQVIPNVDDSLAKELKLKKGIRSLGIITSDCDDVTYIAVDEATKEAAVEVVYARSMYAGAGNASTKLAGEVIAIIAGPSPAEVNSGLQTAVRVIEEDVAFVSANEDDSIPYLAHVVSRTGSFLSNEAGITEGEAIAYLIAPPNEAIVGIDEALKSADVKLATFYGPPSETNFAGALLTGTQSACKAAVEAFASTVCRVADTPRVM
ncbi:ethanolamine utilization protein EutL [Pilibacter termitis]|uniref:Ethanolamine utilization protein EutL n=1 Tax=Pilibacter termitis TaxID=263852 RepID=A0A1T4K6M0_9ENTE|nr:ethanolamine utilization microcompartment protein EutL [Pilibacter termitis]SJZ37945.1 ethanolamine utilization protein EutL [Pilibacter termitis]